ncbi:MAG: glycosyltransferase [Candidatus Nanohalobium sp.]
MKSENDKTSPLVSVILPVYEPNTEWLNDTIESVLNQTYDRIELVIVNDGSSNRLKHYVDGDKLKRENVRTYYQENQGFTGAANNCIDKSEGKYIAPIGQDDLWKESKIEKQVDILEKENGDLIFSKVQIIDELGEEKHVRGSFPEKRIAKKLFTKGVYPEFESLVIKRNILSNLQLNKDYEIASDLKLWMETFSDFKVLYIDEKLTKKRIHQNNTSKNHLKTLREVESIYRDHLDNFEFSWVQRRNIFSNLYRRKGKGLYQDEGKAWKARKLWLKSLKFYPDPKALMLLLLSFNSAVYEKANDIYSKS